MMTVHRFVSARRLALLTAPIALLAIAIGSACGGGGGGGTGGGGTGTVGYPADIAAAAFFKGTATPASGLGTGSDPYILVPGDSVQLQLWGTNSITAKPQQVSAANYSFVSPSPSTSVATLSGSGVLTAVGASSGTYTVSISWQGGSGYSAGSSSFVFEVASAGAKVSGTVIDTTKATVSGVFLRFYNSSGVELMETETGSDGTFTANVPTGATTFLADASGLTGCTGYSASAACYYTEYEYNSLYYSQISSTCYTPLPTLSTGRTVALPEQVILLPTDDASNPPPPPTGCQG
jgi:hypothetical protein